MSAADITDRAVSFILANLSEGDTEPAKHVADALGYNYHGTSTRKSGETVFTFLPLEECAGSFTRAFLRILNEDGSGWDYNRAGGAGMVLVNVWPITAEAVVERDARREAASEASKASKAKNKPSKAKK